MIRTLKTRLKRLSHHQFMLGQRLGFNILPNHFYSEIPDIRKLRASQEWRREYSMTGVRGADLDEQLSNLRSIAPNVLPEQKTLYADVSAENGDAGYGPIESEALLHFVITLQPKRIVQVGAGFSTAIILRGAKIAGYAPHIRCIDPFPSAILKRYAAESRIELVSRPAENLDPSEAIAGLGSGDLLFIDGSHSLGPAGEVTRVVLEWLPRLPAGTYVHHHDIYFPYDYGRTVIRSALFFWHETALLYAFLCMNSEFRLFFSMSMLHYKRQEALKGIFPNYAPAADELGIVLKDGHFPSANYIVRA